MGSIIIEIEWLLFIDKFSNTTSNWLVGSLFSFDFQNSKKISISPIIFICKPKLI
jgi:hypothetical protein